MGDSLPDSESGNGRRRGWFILLHCMSWKRDNSWGKFSRFMVILSKIRTLEEDVVV